MSENDKVIHDFQVALTWRRWHDPSGWTFSGYSSHIWVHPRLRQ